MYHLSTDTTGKWNIVGDYKNILKPSGLSGRLVHKKSSKGTSVR